MIPGALQLKYDLLVLRTGQMLTQQKEYYKLRKAGYNAEKQLSDCKAVETEVNALLPAVIEMDAEGTYKAFTGAIAGMQAWQRTFWRSREKNDLIKAKSHEHRVMQMITKAQKAEKQKQTELF